MEANLVFFTAIIIGIFWIFYVVKNNKNKLFFITGILFLLIAIYGFYATFAGKNIELNNVEDFGNATKLYLSWFVNLFDNLKVITANAVKLDWKGNQTA